MLLTEKDKVALVVCSDELGEKSSLEVVQLIKTLNSLGLEVVYDESIYKGFSTQYDIFKNRASSLMNYFKDPSIKAIFDVSGGDLANGILEHLDYDVLKNNPKAFFGYSDLSVVINGLYKKTGIETYLYQIRNLVGKDSSMQCLRFKESIMGDKNSIFNFDYEWIQGTQMEGVVVGGNLRCLLKLAGTEYMPDFTGKILFLESLGGDVNKMVTYLNQYKMLGAFRVVKGIILGSYTEMERENYSPTIAEIVLKIVNDKNIPIIKTKEIGHSKDSKCIVIGRKISLKS